MTSGDPFTDLGFFKKTQDLGLDYFVPQNPIFCPISTIFDRFWHWLIFFFVKSGLDSKTRYLGVKPFKNLSLLNAFSKCRPECIPPDTWLGSRIFRTWWHENSKIPPKPDLYFPVPWFELLIRAPSRSQVETQGNWRRGLSITMYRLQKNKNPQSENNHITIMNTFWSTELNFRLILSHGGSICVSET